MSSTPHFREELNRVAWPLLVAVAQRRETMTYQDLATAINRTLKTDYQSHLVGSNALDLIERYCIRKGLPDLTAMVVRKDDDLPGPDFYRANGLRPDLGPGFLRAQWNQIRNAVWAYPWPPDPPDAW